jgi:hypothetical protein
MAFCWASLDRIQLRYSFAAALCGAFLKMAAVCGHAIQGLRLGRLVVDSPEKLPPLPKFAT